jgi:hypothetical protein
MVGFLSNQLLMSLAPSIGVATAIRADILNALRSRGSIADMIALVSPSLTVINQWASQLPLLLSVGPALDLLFNLRKDLFNGPSFVQPSFGTPLADLPEAFRDFSSLIRDVIAHQKAEKPVSKVRFFYCLINLVDQAFMF